MKKEWMRNLIVEQAEMIVELKNEAESEKKMAQYWFERCIAAEKGEKSGTVEKPF